ncbi:MAG: linear amide C-N hydrolase [Clostridium sp.]|nr:linear amide C-N hydrolase [Clostridium sp.]
MGKSKWTALVLLAIFSLAGCGGSKQEMTQEKQAVESRDAEAETAETEIAAEGEAENLVYVEKEADLTEKIMELEKGFSAVRYDGDYGFDKFLAEGGASSDKEAADFVANSLLSGADLGFSGAPFGCSTIAVQSAEGEALFGRNFDWNRCEAMAVLSYPENGYASVATVNVDFISQGGLIGMALKKDEIKTIAALYAPLDGMNERGLAVSVNMIQDSATIKQDTEKPDITTTTAVRLLLNQAATVEEAIDLLSRYDMHASKNFMVHFAIADAAGESVVVEYVDNEMEVIKTPVVTNFYLAEGEKNGIGTAQSHTRYEMLTERLAESGTMSPEEVRDALSSVSKGNFGEFESTEWSIVFNQTKRQAIYYHRENYKQGYLFEI